MEHQVSYKKLKLNFEKDEQYINNIKKFEINKRKLLAKINRSNSNINSESLYPKIKKNTENSKSKLNIRVIKSNIIQEKKEKEINDLDKINQKWNRDKILLKINNRCNDIRSYKEENIKASYLTYKRIKLNEWKQKYDREMNNSINKKKSENNILETKKFDNLKEIVGKNNKIYSSKEIKALEKDIENELNEIYQKANKILDKKNENLIEKLEYILKVGKILEKEIKVNKNNNLILPGNAIFYKDNIIIKFLGYFGSELCLNNIKTYIEINPTNELLRDITFKIITSGLAMQKIYKLTIDSQKYKKQFEENIEKWNTLLNDIKLKIGSTFNISPINMYFFEQKCNSNNFEIKLLIYDQKLNNLDNILKKFDIKVTTSTLLNNIILSPIFFEKNFCKEENDWPRDNLIRGGRKYYPPYGWIGIALKVKDKFNKDNNIWLGKENKEGEWCVAYHGVGKGKVLDKVLNIIYDNLKEGYGQMYNKQLNAENNKDIFQYCGNGVYFSPNIEEAMKYADKISLGWYNLKFKLVIMARVKPDNIRSPGGSPVIWILSGNDDEIRPYRLLIKVIYT